MAAASVLTPGGLVNFTAALWEKYQINPFLPSAAILYPLKTWENQRFSGVFRGYKMETSARNGLRDRRQILLLILSKY